jgi:hypothetical protein
VKKRKRLLSVGGRRPSKAGSERGVAVADFIKIAAGSQALGADNALSQSFQKKSVR